MDIFSSSCTKSIFLDFPYFLWDSDDVLMQIIVRPSEKFLYDKCSVYFPSNFPSPIYVVSEPVLRRKLM